MWRLVGVGLWVVAVAGCGAQPRIPAMTLGEARAVCLEKEPEMADWWDTTLIDVEAVRDEGLSKIEALAWSSTFCDGATDDTDTRADCVICTTAIIDALWQ